MSTEDHLKMFHCLVDTGADVLRNLAEICLLDNKKKSFYQFLEDEKHYFYHQFEQKILCCECPPHGCTVSRGKIEAHVFNKVYEFKKERINKSHTVKNGMTNQKCLHAIHTRNVILDDLDLSDLNYFLWTKGKLIPQETAAIKIIMDTRNRICHPSSTTGIGLYELNNMWTELENAILDLSQPERYKNMVKMCIESHRERQERETGKILHGMNQIKETVKDELTKTRTDLTDESKEQTRMLRQLIGCFENLSVFAQASPQIGVDECQASGGNGQIIMTTTLELPSLSNEEQRQIVENFSSELKIGSEDKSITIDGKQVNSIVLDLRVSSSIFRDTETLRSALMALVREVVDKGNIDTTVQDTVYVTLTFNSRLSWHETEVLKGVLTPKMLDITDVESEGQMHNDTPGKINLLYSRSDVIRCFVSSEKQS
ncbi:unnamed protein product [Mytilus coruscus]|uniref:DZIP3-like HEPN domain-containing protein n=1 Tax=Mytilus coruscus TaxID=42192 RepID=A0A6J8ETP1_MYTCO|nr:unnamed protein product [Mytilus coruscus]